MKYTDYVVLIACWIVLLFACIAGIALIVLVLIFFFRRFYKCASTNYMTVPALVL